MICPWCEKEIEVEGGFCPFCRTEIPKELFDKSPKYEIKNKCIRCNGNMISIGEETIQLGRYGFFMGHLSNLLSGGLEVSIYICDKCGKVEFYSTLETQEP